MSTTNGSNSTENEPLVVSVATNDMVIPTSTGSKIPEPTVRALLHSSDETLVEQGTEFLRRVFALLVFQYSIILVVASPFVLLTNVQDVTQPHYRILEILSILGILASLVLALTRGSIYPYSKYVLISLTLSVAVKLGLSLEKQTWENYYGLIAVAQVPTNFAIMVCIFQFDTLRHTWISTSQMASTCLLSSVVWMVILTESGLYWKNAIYVSLGGWLYSMLILHHGRKICRHVAPSEYVFATLFVLFPKALYCLPFSKKRRVTSEYIQESASRTKYDVVSDV